MKNILHKKPDQRMRILCIAILSLHIGWVLIHMILHHLNIVDPWKMMGYAMYTRPASNYYASVDLEKIESPQQHKNSIINQFRTYANAGCASGISKRFYKVLPRLKPDLLKYNEPITMSFFRRAPIMLSDDYENVKIGKAKLILKENEKLFVEETFCDKKREFSINVQTR